MADIVYARVIVDVPLAHLDRTFDYAVTAEQRVEAVVGARVRVRFAGRRVLGYISELAATTERPEKIQPLLEVLGPSVVTPAQFQLVSAVAHRWLGTKPELLRAAIPARHARAEKDFEALFPDARVPLPKLPDDRRSAWSRYESGADFLAGLAATETPRASLITGPGDNSFDFAIDAVLAAGGRSIVVVPDRRDLDALEELAKQRLPKGSWVQLAADLGPATRYRNYLRLLSGEVTIAFGTRSAVFAPVSDLRLVVVVEEGDDSLAEKQAPTWHAREVSALSVVEQKAAWLAVGASRSVEVQAWIARGWAHSIAQPRELERKSAPTVRATSDVDLARDPVARSARLPAIVFGVLREGLTQGPVLVSVPRRGYQLNLICAGCRQPAKCGECAGPLQRKSANQPPACMWCGLVATAFDCAWCQRNELVSFVVGAARTAEEIARAFPGVKLVRSGRDAVVPYVTDEPQLVIATPGAEPRVKSGHYAAAAILDASAALGRVDLRADEEAFRRWRQIGSLVAPVSGRIAIAGDDSHPVIQALIRNDPEGFARRVLGERIEAGLPPQRTVVEVFADVGRLQSVQFDLPNTVRSYGPLLTKRGDGQAERILLMAERGDVEAMLSEVRALLVRHDASKAGGLLVAYVDPVALA